MNRHRFHLCTVALLAALLSACATPVGQLAEADFVWSEFNLSRPPSRVYQQVMERQRRCGGEFAFEGNFYPDTTLNHIDVYLTNAFTGTRNNFVLGTIELRPGGGSTTDVRVGVQKIYDNPVFAARGLKRQTMVDTMRNPTLPCEYQAERLSDGRES